MKTTSILNKLEAILISCKKQNCNKCELKDSKDCLDRQLKYIKEIKDNIKNGHI